MRKRTLAGIIGTTLLAGALALGGCASSPWFTTIGDPITLPEGFHVAQSAGFNLYLDRINLSFLNYMSAKKHGSDYFNTFDFPYENSYTNSCDTFAGELVYRLIDDFASCPWLRAGQIYHVLKIAEYIEPEMIYQGYERIGDYSFSEGNYDEALESYLDAFESDMNPEIIGKLRKTQALRTGTPTEIEIPTFETIPALYRPVRKRKIVPIIDGIPFEHKLIENEN